MRGSGFPQLMALCRRFVEQRAELEGFTAHQMKTGSSRRLLRELHSRAKECNRCPLARSRTNLVFGEGGPEAKVVFVGEAPGREEDVQGRPFVGAAGKLLTKMIESIGLKREEVYIANVLKCRPPGNRNPRSEEVDNCMPWLESQLSVLEPRVICALGTFAAQALLKTDKPISQLRGKVFNVQGIKLIPSYHPAALIYHPEWKRSSWEDLKLLKKVLDQSGDGS